MIRGEVDGRMCLVAQHDHAVLAGRLAECWGNEQFSVPERREETLSGIAQHDCGWPLHDDWPTLNEAGFPLDVFETPTDLAIRVWSASAERAEAAGDYAALLVSLHVLSLSTIEPSRARMRHETFNLNKFQHREIERQHELRRRLGLRTDIPVEYGLAEPGTSLAEDQLRFNLALLQATDRLSLAMCGGARRLFRCIDRVYARAGGEEIALTVDDGCGGACGVQPWPFGEASVSLTIPCRWVSGAPFEDEREFQRAYAGGELVERALTLRSDRAEMGG